MLVAEQDEKIVVVIELKEGRFGVSAHGNRNYCTSKVIKCLKHCLKKPVRSEMAFMPQ